MSEGRSAAPIRALSALLTDGVVGASTDAQLVEQFRTRDGEAAQLAFSAIVERHGPMVLRAAQGVLHNLHAAEDVYQATFIVLARKASRLRVSDSLAPWLYSVARRIAASARSAEVRRRRREHCAAATEAISAPRVPDWEDVLHEEIGRLPERCRRPILLCDLGGMTGEQAAVQLGWPVGTVWSRLARGRQRLRDRLQRRGLTLPELQCMPLILGQARRSVPRGLVDSTVKAAFRTATNKEAAESVSASVVQLINRDSSIMAIRWLRTSAVAVLLPLGLISGYLASSPGASSQSPSAQKKPPESAVDERIRPILGTWIAHQGEGPDNFGNKIVIRFLSKDRDVTRGLGFDVPFVCTLTYVTEGESASKPSALLLIDPATNPPHMTYQPLGFHPGDSSSLDGSPGIYRIEGDRLWTCEPSRIGDKRPDRFEKGKDNENILRIYRRVVDAVSPRAEAPSTPDKSEADSP